MRRVAKDLDHFFAIFLSPQWNQGGTLHSVTRQVMKATVGFMDWVQVHEFAVVEGSLARVVLLGNNFECKVGV